MSANKDLGFNIALVGVFSLLAFVGLVNHELWSDEVHHWFMARDSKSIAEMLVVAKDNWHPLMWNLLLYGLTLLTTDVMAMQLLQGLIVAGAAGVFVFASPFTRIQKSLFLLGYYPLYEYGVFSRNYSLISLFLFTSLWLYIKRKDSPVWMGMSLFLLANTHLLGTIVAGAFLTIIVYTDFIKSRPAWPDFSYVSISLLGVILALIQVNPSYDTGIIRSWVSEISPGDWYRASMLFAKGFFPVPDFGRYHFWNHNLFDNLPLVLIVILGAVFMALPFLLLRRNKTGLLFFTFVAVGMFSFTLTAGLSAARYFGAIFLAYIGATWLMLDEEKSAAMESKEPGWAAPVFTVLLILQAIGGVSAWTLDVMRPFSASRDLATYIKQNQLIDKPLLVDNCLRAPAVAYLGNQAYFLSSGEFGSYCHWDQMGHPIHYLSDAELIERALQFVVRENRSALLVTNKPLTLYDPSITLIQSFERAIIETESFWLYKVGVERN